MLTRNVHGTPEARLPKQLTTCRVWTAFKRQFDHVGASPGTCTPPESGTRRIRICPPHTKLRCLASKHSEDMVGMSSGRMAGMLAITTLTLCLRELHPLGSPLGKALIRTCFHTNRRLRPYSGLGSIRGIRCEGLGFAWRRIFAKQNSKYMVSALSSWLGKQA